jgi:hypothetical protein
MVQLDASHKDDVHNIARKATDTATGYFTVKTRDSRNLRTYITRSKPQFYLLTCPQTGILSYVSTRPNLC